MQAEARRRELLGALGIDLYVPRAVPKAGRAAMLLVVCAEADARTSDALHLRRILPNALGVEASCILWMSPEATALPPAVACLVLGARPPGVHDAQLSTMRQNGEMIAVADKPDACLGSPVAKRALWQILKPVARRLRGAG
jgi:hypothetical protein